MLKQHGLHPADVPGTGFNGRITRTDVERAVAARATSDAPVEPEPVEPDPVEVEDAPVGWTDGSVDLPQVAPVATTEAATGEVGPSAPPEPDERLVPFTPIRRRIAMHLKESLATAAHAFCSVEVDYERVERVRRARGPAWRTEYGFSLTYLPFVARATLDALREFPHLNASVVDDGIIVRRAIHLGIAVDLDHGGLIVPVIRDAHDRRLPAIAAEISDLAARARAGGLTPDDVNGGTFTITNPGPHGTLLSIPIINQPQVGILVTDGVRRRPVMIPTGDGGEGIAVHSVGTLGLSFDHRAVDGAYAAAFVARVKELLETRDWDPEL
jgi:2-oxoglutarate dehydrogenase E2 component (dihydrolipoamide succinyltransferase)